MSNERSRSTPVLDFDDLVEQMMANEIEQQVADLTNEPRDHGAVSS